MSENTPKFTTRREFIKQTGAIAAGTAVFAAGMVPNVHSSVNDTIKLALVGCGGRGSGAASNALSVQTGPTRLVAMADVFEDRVKRSYQGLTETHATGIDLPEDRKFIGMDAYKDAMDCLDPGDIVILATPPAFRWVHFTYAIERGLNVFMEKPLTVDGPTTRRMFELAEQADAKNLKVGVGLMCRHCDARQELYDRIRDGQIGDILTLRAYRMHGEIGFFRSGPKPDDISDLMYQVQRFHSFIWSGGGAYSDFYIHNIDECCWMKDAWPIQAQSTGGRHYRGDSVDQNFDNYSTEYTFADGTKLFMYGRCIEGCETEFASYAHGTRGSAIISAESHTPAKCRIFSGQDLTRKDQVTWAFGRREPNPYQLEWEHLTEAIREDRPFNEVKRGATASLVTSMGRMAAHTGRIVTFDEMLNSDHEYAPGLDTLTADSSAPLPPGPDGRYAVPQPGLVTDREY